MRVFLVANNWVGWKVAEYLSNNEQIVGLALHPISKAKYREEIIEASDISEDRIIDGSKINNDYVLNEIQALRPDICISTYFAYILSKEAITIFPEGVINLHPSFLPYNRGCHPNVWSIIDETPAGVTLHYIDETIDTGDIIAQRKVSSSITDTGKSLYHKLEKEALKLFIETWLEIKSKNFSPNKQAHLKGTYHTKEELVKIGYIDINRKYKARELLNIIRAKTFPPYEGAYIIEDGKKVYLRLELERE